MKLFYVVGEIGAMFVDDSGKYYSAAKDALYKELNNGGGEIENLVITEIKTEKEIPKGWLGAIPWFSKDDKRVEQIIREKSKNGETIELDGQKYKLTKVE